MTAPPEKDADAARIELETKVMFLEDTLESLNDVILAQGEKLELLTRRLDDVLGRVSDLADDLGSKRKLEDDRPPHY